MFVIFIIIRNQGFWNDFTYKNKGNLGISHILFGTSFEKTSKNDQIFIFVVLLIFQ